MFGECVAIKSLSPRKLLQDLPRVGSISYIKQQYEFIGARSRVAWGVSSEEDAALLFTLRRARSVRFLPFLCSPFPLYLQLCCHRSSLSLARALPSIYFTPCCYNLPHFKMSDNIFITEEYELSRRVIFLQAENFTAFN